MAEEQVPQNGNAEEWHSRVKKRRARGAASAGSHAAGEYKE
jgi:hypothetical protein